MNPKNEKTRLVIVQLLAILSLVGMTEVGHCVSTKKEDAIKKIENAAKPEKIKMKAEEVKEMGKEKVHKKIDQAAAYLDKDKIKKEAHLLVEEYLDKDKINAFIDTSADHLDQIKETVNMLYDSFDRDKIKYAVEKVIASIDIDQLKQSFDQSVDQIASSLDKEEIKEKFDQTVDHVAGSLQEATTAIENEIKQVGTNEEAIQKAIQKHKLQALLPPVSTYGPATLSHLKLGDTKMPFCIAKPGQVIDGEVVCALDRKQCFPLGFYRVVLGLSNKGGQTSIFNHFGLRSKKETDHFMLVAPVERGIYQVAFRVVEAARETTAINLWDEPAKEGWGEPAVIGLLFVL